MDLLKPDTWMEIPEGCEAAECMTEEGMECPFMRIFKGGRDRQMDVYTPLHPPTSTAQGNESWLCPNSKARAEKNRNKQVHLYCVCPSPTYYGPAPQAPAQSSSLLCLFSSSLTQTFTRALSFLLLRPFDLFTYPLGAGRGGIHVLLGSQLSPDLLCHWWSLTLFWCFQIPFRTTSSLPASLQFSGVETHVHGLVAPNLRIKVLCVPAPGAEQHDPDSLPSHQTGLWVWISLASGPSPPTNSPTLTPGSASFQNQIMRPASSCSRSWDPGLQNSSLLLGLLNPPLIRICHFLLLPLFPTSPSYPRADKIV